MLKTVKNNDHEQVLEVADAVRKEAEEFSSDALLAVISDRENGGHRAFWAGMGTTSRLEAVGYLEMLKQQLLNDVGEL